MSRAQTDSAWTWTQTESAWPQLSSVSPTTVQYPVVLIAPLVTSGLSASDASASSLSATPSGFVGNALLVSRPYWLDANRGPTPQVLDYYSGSLTPGSISREDIERIRGEWE